MLYITEYRNIEVKQEYRSRSKYQLPTTTTTTTNTTTTSQEVPIKNYTYILFIESNCEFIESFNRLNEVLYTSCQLSAVSCQPASPLLRSQREDAHQAIQSLVPARAVETNVPLMILHIIEQKKKVPLPVTLPIVLCLFLSLFQR